MLKDVNNPEGQHKENVVPLVMMQFSSRKKTCIYATFSFALVTSFADLLFLERAITFLPT